MPHVRPEDAIERAKGLRKQAKEAHTASLKRSLEAAADRLERNAAKNAQRIGRSVIRKR